MKTRRISRKKNLKTRKGGLGPNPFAIPLPNDDFDDDGENINILIGKLIFFITGIYIVSVPIVTTYINLK
tara:strand:+ start:126 stop:335 length:210 start_codon:yes stop_codon:yes gene_type:complete